MKNQSSLIQNISSAIDTKSSADFYNTLIKKLVETLKVDYAFIGRYEQEKNTIHATPFYSQNAYEPGFYYNLEKTPCNSALSDNVCIVSEDVCNEYPDDNLLKEMKIESYAGARLNNSTAEPIGVLVVLSTKPFPDPDLVGDIIKIFATRVALEIERERTDEILTHHSMHDTLTGLINRSRFEEHLKEKIDHARDFNETHSLCHISLNQFKVINDTAGHSAGDKLLQEISVLLKQKIREIDILSRIGGDEFSILLVNSSVDHAFSCAQNVLSLIQNYKFIWKEHTYRICVSIGLTQIDKNSCSYTEVLKQADISHHTAKESGSNRIHVYEEDSEIILNTQNEMEWSPKIIKALESNGFELFIQKIEPITDADLKPHYEVLLRMRHADGSLIPPGSFLPCAERYGLIEMIDHWVIDHLFGWIIQNIRQLPPASRFSINISGTTLGNESTINYITKWFDTGLLPTERFCFEITETMAITNLQQAYKFIHTVKSYNCCIALDDFGSGLASFGYLKNLNADILKIDGIFIRNMLNDTVDRALVESINHIGHLLGMKTVAEFAENDELIAELKIIGLDYAQGYGISRPAPINSLLNNSQ